MPAFRGCFNFTWAVQSALGRYQAFPRLQGLRCVQARSSRSTSVSSCSKTRSPLGIRKTVSCLRRATLTTATACSRQVNTSTSRAAQIPSLKPTAAKVHAFAPPCFYISDGIYLLSITSPRGFHPKPPKPGQQHWKLPGQRPTSYDSSVRKLLKPREAQTMFDALGRERPTSSSTCVRSGFAMMAALQSGLAACGTGFAEKDITGSFLLQPLFCATVQVNPTPSTNCLGGLLLRLLLLLCCRCCSRLRQRLTKGAPAHGSSFLN